MNKKTVVFIIAVITLIVLCGVIGSCLAGKPLDPAVPHEPTLDANGVRLFFMSTPRARSEAQPLEKTQERLVLHNKSVV